MTRQRLADVYINHRIADFIAQVIRNPAIGIDIEEILPQPLGKKPARNREILVMGAGQTTTILLRLG